MVRNDLMHIEIGGVPFCDANIGYGELQRNAPAKIRYKLVCGQIDRAIGDKVVAYLCAHGHKAVLVDGGCPSYGRPVDED